MLEAMLACKKAARGSSTPSHWRTQGQGREWRSAQSQVTRLSLPVP